MPEYIKQIPNSNFWITITGNIYKVTNSEVINVQRYVKMGENFTPNLFNAKFDFELTNGIICKNAYVCIFIKKLFPGNLFCNFLPNLNLNRDAFEAVVNYLNTNFGIIPMEELLITAESFTLV